jgi:sortase A
MKRKIVTALTVALIVVGLWQCGYGVWIYAKAQVAQYLLRQAWSRTLNGKEHVDPWPWADTWPVARLLAPQHDVDLIVLAGASGRTLAFGPAVVNDDVSGTVVISGHRDTHFQFVQKLSDGDELIIQRPGKAHRTYRVTETHVFDNRTTGIVNDPDRDHLVLVTCYPFDAIIPGGPLRYVVTGEAE